MRNSPHSLAKANLIAVSGAVLAILTGAPVLLSAGQSAEFTDGKAASSQLGQVNLLTTAGNNRGGVANGATLSDPVSVAVDPTTGKVFVADNGNNRVLRFGSTAALANGIAAEAVLGQANYLTTAGTISRSRFSDPRSVCCDEDGRLWVLDGTRVLRFDAASTLANGANADGVLGQADYTTNTPNTEQNGLGDPSSIFVSVTGALWVSSPDLNRVTRFANAAGKAAGANADSVLGQVDFAASAAATTISGMSAPTGITVDLAGNLYIADSGNHRVLVFKDADTGANGRDADIVLGQLLDTTAEIGLGAAGMSNPVGVTISNLGTLFVGDRDNDRVLVFKNAANKGNGGDADGVLGQSSLETPVPLSVSRSFNSVAGLWADGGNRLWAVDTGFARVMRFDTDQFQPDGKIGTKATSLRGDGFYNQTGAGQQAAITVAGSKKARAYLTVENDGDVTDDLRLSGPAGNRAIRLSYFQTGAGNVSAKVVAGTLSLADLSAGQGIQFVVEAKGDRKQKDRRSILKARFYAKSLTDGESDRLNCTVAKRP